MMPRFALSGSGPAVVLVPGMEGSGRLFYRQVPLLAARLVWGLAYGVLNVTTTAYAIGEGGRISWNR
mgnify:CR=1 FL=1